MELGYLGVVAMGVIATIPTMAQEKGMGIQLPSVKATGSTERWSFFGLGMGLPSFTTHPTGQF